MQTIKRCSYALASYDQKTQDHDIYMEKKAELENACKKVALSAAKFLSGEELVATHARYSEEKHLTICCYKGHVFAGFQDRKTNGISFSDTSNAFVYMPLDTPTRLAERMENAIKDTYQNRPNIMSQQVTAMWEPLLPILDKIIEYENEFTKLPKYAQDALEKRGEKEGYINKILSQAGSMPFPSREVNEVISFKNNTTKDLCNIPLRERFSSAIDESKNQTDRNQEKIIERNKGLGD